MTQRQSIVEDEISLKSLILKIRAGWSYLLRKWLIIGILSFIGGILGYLYALNKKPIYIASTTFVLESGEGGSSMGSLAGLASMAGVDLNNNAGGIFQGDNLPELYKSRKMIEKTLFSRDENNKLLIDDYVEINNLRKAWEKRPDLISLKFSDTTLSVNNRLRDSVLSKVVDDINANYLSVSKLDKKLSIIKVEVKSKNETFSKAFNDKIVQNVNDFYKKTKTKKSQDNLSILEHKTDSVRAIMNGNIYTVSNVTDATPNLNPTRGVLRIAPIQKSQFNAEINKAVLSSLVQNLEMSKLALLKETPLIQVLDQPVYPLPIIKFGKLKGLVLGGLIAAFLTISILACRKILKSILQ